MEGSCQLQCGGMMFVEILRHLLRCVKVRGEVMMSVDPV